MGARGTIRLLPGEGADDLLTRATAEHKPIASLCLFSGGGDSAVLAHRCRDAYEALVFIDTGTAVPGVREHVERFAAWLDKPLRVYDSGDAFRRMVLQWGKCKRCAGTGEVHETAFLVLPAGVAVRCPKCDGTGRVPFGFPGPAQHARAYTRLKDEAHPPGPQDPDGARDGDPRPRAARAGQAEAAQARPANVRKPSSLAHGQVHRLPPAAPRSGSQIFTTCLPVQNWPERDRGRTRT
jgi:pimeloyl-ACP methyl ester carboxylesterase